MRVETMSSALSQSHRLPENVTHCKSVILSNHDRAVLGGHVVYIPPFALNRVMTPCVRRVEEILADSSGHAFLGILVSQCIIGEVVLPYRMPMCRVISSEHCFLSLEVSA